jgi:superfamily II DNA or RNA helicase
MPSFSEFEDLLRERYPDHNRHGTEFERAAKWMLETHPVYVAQLRRVWRYQDWPGYWGPDDGVDLVAEHMDGSLWAIQVKCFKPDHSLTKAELDSFLAASGREEFSERLLIATTDLVGRTADRTLKAQEKPVRRFMRNDFVRAPLVWPSDPATMAGGGLQPKREPRPHQEEAIDAVLAGLEDRGQLIMACGTGKTLTSLWINEALEADRTLVLLPSLTLLSQLVTEWTASADEPFAFLPVCSDETVAQGADSAVMFASDLQYPATTDPGKIADFLRLPGRRVIFSTYQSSPRIAAAQADSSVPDFDVVFADEAHRCAGKVSTEFGTILDSEQIRAKKLLFMTATPRTFTSGVASRAAKEGLDIASMDDANVFGPVLHRLSFNQAIEDDLLTDYQVVVVLVDDARIHELIEAGYHVEIDSGVEANAKTLAAHIGIAKAIRDYELSRLITFHSRVSTAKKFAERLPEVAKWMPPDERPLGKIVAWHVSGEMATGLRNNRLDQLRNIESGQHGLITNARCLSEGIDVPALDGVAFVDPRRSQVDVVQAVGRAIRRAENKPIGTIIIPVYVTSTEDPDEALESSEFKPVWDVINALRAHDEELAIELDQLRVRSKTEGETRDQEFPERIKIDAPVRIGQEFSTALKTLIVARTTSSWLDNFAALLKFVDREGHARVPQDHVEPINGSTQRLGSWVATQRGQRRKGQLPPDRVALLDSLPGWYWGRSRTRLNAEQFELNLAALRQFVDRNGHARVPQDHKELFEGSELGLGAWVVIKRTQYRAGSLLPSRVAALEAFPGWDWGKARGRRFNTVVHDEELHLALLIHKDRYGHPWPAEEFEIEGIRPLHELFKMQNIYRSAPNQKNRSEGSVRRALERVEERWAALAELFPEYPKEFPQSQYFLSNSALVAGAAVDLAGSDEDLRDRERQSLEVRALAERARAVINTDNRPVADSAVASLRSIKGWSDESFSDWEARMAQQEEMAARRQEVQHVRAFFVVWRALFSKAPELLNDPSKPVSHAVFEKRLAAMEQSTMEQIGNDLSVTRERVRQVEAYLRRILEAQIFDVRNPSFAEAAAALAEIDPDSNASGVAEVMELLGTTLATEEAPDNIKTAPKGLTTRRMTRAKQLADLLDLLGVPADHLPQDLIGDAGRFWMGSGVTGKLPRDAAEVAAAAFALRMNQKMLSNSADDLETSPVSVLGLSTRPKNCLAEAGIETVGELMEFSDEQLLALRNMGEGSVKEIRARLNELVAPSADLGDLETSPVSVLGLSTRPKNCLAEAGIETVGELMELSDEQLLALRNMGEGSVKEVRLKLEKFQDHRHD